MELQKVSDDSKLPFPVPTYRFDQKNEMFKRSIWDEKMQPHRKRFYEEIVYQQKIGYRKLDHAFRNATWNLEWGFGFGNGRSNYGLYSWEGVVERIKRYVETGDQVKETPEEMSHIIKRLARFLGADVTGICRVHPNWVYSHEFNLLGQGTLSY